MPSLDHVAQSLRVYTFNNGSSLWLLRFHPFTQKKKLSCVTRGPVSQTVRLIVFLFVLSPRFSCETPQVLFESIKRPFFEMSFTHFVEVAREDIPSRNGRPPFETTMVIVAGRGRPIRGDPRS